MATTIFFTIKDGDGDPSRIELFVDPTLITVADIPAILEAVWDLVNPLINGTLATAGITFEADISGFTNAAAAAISDVQEKAEFVFRSAAQFIKRISLPTFVETFFTNSGAGKVVDTSQAAVTNFTTMITDGVDVGLNTIEFQTSHGEDLETFESGFQAWGKNRV